MTGGLGASGLAFTTRNGETFEGLTNLPEDDGNHCHVVLDENRLFITGFGVDDNESYIYDKSFEIWSGKANLTTPRINMACGVIGKSSGDLEVVTAGGQYGGETAVEIYNVATDTWRTGE